MNNRWIDQYFLRYAVGTVVGAVVVAYLSTRLPGDLRGHLPHFDTWGKIVALTASGLAFCYIASAPLLIIHVGRCLLVSAESEKRRLGILSTGVSVLFAFAVPYFILRLGFSHSILMATIMGILLVQIAILYALHQERKTIFKFYNDLALARRAAKELDIVESYRGIREHANAYSIVLAEVLLAMLVFGFVEDQRHAKDSRELFATLLELITAWIAPSAFILASAARLETDFVDSYVKSGEQQLPPSQNQTAQKPDTNDNRQDQGT